MDENSEGLLDFLSKFNPLTADYRKEEPTSVKTMRGATALTPLDSVVEIGKELKKEEPDYKKIGLLTAMEAAGAVAPMAKPVLTAVKSSKAAQPFKKTRKAYRIATQAEDGKLYPLFVNADDEIPVGQWISASIPPITFKGKNGNMYVPSKGAKRSKGEKAKPTGDMQVLPDQETADKLREAGFSVEKPSKAAPFGKVRAVASRPGYHATTKPVAHHLGPEDLIINEAEKNKLIKAGITPKAFKEKTFNYLDGKLISKKKIADLSEEEKKRVTKQKKFYVKRRAEDQVFLEVDMADDTSEELLSYMNARGRTDINDKLPEGGSYTYQDGQADAETWVVGGDMKVNRVLDRDEALTIQKKMGVKDLPLRSEVEDILERNFSNGGLVEEGIDMYQGQDDSLLVEGIGMAKGGLPEQMAMNFGDVPDNTVGQDPVSGNDIPLGSTAENVRDDIPANLSEGEIVVPADVVNFHGVKLFEDLRAEAKMGYQEMAQDGRIGGEPMDMNNDMGMDIELSELDLEIMDDEAPVEMNRGGTSMKDYKDVAKNRDIKAPKRTAPRKTHAEIMASAFRDDDKKDNSPAAISARVQARKNDPKTRGEALLKRLNNIVFGDDDDDRRVKLYEKPRTSDDIGPSIADKINFGGKGFDFRNNQSPTPPPPNVRQSTKGAGSVPYMDDDETFSVRYADQPFYKRLVQNLKRDLGMDEGGLVEDTNLIGGEDQFNQPFYDPDQKGGFDMENAYTNYGDGTGGGPLLEMREYMNDAGHRIFITFIDGVPQMEIPAGYYPVEGEGVAVAPEAPPVGGSGGSDSGGSGGGGMDMPAPTPINYKELTMEELSEMVEDQKKMKGDVIAGGISTLSPFIGGAMKVAMWNTTRQTKKEIQRRRDDPYTSEVDKRRYDQLLEIANAEEPGLIATLLGKITGNDPYAPEVRTPEQTDALYAQLDKMTKAYTPDVQEASNRTTPGVDEEGEYPSTFDDETRTKIKQASADAATEAFGAPPKTVEPVGQDKFIQSVKDDPSSFLPPTPSPDRSSANNQSAADEAMGRPTSRTPSREEQMMVQGINKGARVTKKRKKKKSK